MLILIGDPGRSKLGLYRLTRRRNSAVNVRVLALNA